VQTNLREGSTFVGRELERRPERFVGLRVTLIGKDAIRWENTTVTGVDGVILLLAGGEQVTQVFTDSPVSKPIVEPLNGVPLWEIARGVVVGARAAGGPGAQIATAVKPPKPDTGAASPPKGSTPS
jgi:hypothetical protein